MQVVKLQQLYAGLRKAVADNGVDLSGFSTIEEARQGTYRMGKLDLDLYRSGSTIPNRPEAVGAVLLKTDDRSLEQPRSDVKVDNRHGKTRSLDWLLGIISTIYKAKLEHVRHL